MDRLITVKGYGRVLAKPDYIKIAMHLESKDKDYGKAMEKAADRIESLTKALSAVGFGKDDVRTADFSVKTETEYRKGLSGSKQIVTGFAVRQGVMLAFDLDLARLDTVMGAIGKWSRSDPDLTIRFTVKDSSAVKDALLASAARNAKHQAEQLCAAAGAKLGNLVKVEYDFQGTGFDSATSYRPCFNAMSVTGDVSVHKMMMFDRIRPDDIDARDSATFVWEIE